MTFARGATLTTATTLGHSDTSNLGPTAGNGFYTRWPDDLALLQELGITDIRLTLDWARLQPKPGDLELSWIEFFENIVQAATAIDLRVWATLHDGAEPRWVSNEGGLGDAETAAKWWPRWVERIADRFGDDVHGWIPFAGIDAAMPLQPWKDTWAVLHNGDAPVVASFTAADDLALIPSFLDYTDRVGLVLGSASVPTTEPKATQPKATRPKATQPEATQPGVAQLDDADLDRFEERVLASFHGAADLASDSEFLVTQFTPHRTDPDIAAAIVERFVDATTTAIDDKIDIGVVFLDPAIAGPDSPIGLFDKDRSPQPAAAAFIHTESPE